MMSTSDKASLSEDLDQALTDHKQQTETEHSQQELISRCLEEQLLEGHGARSNQCLTEQCHQGLGTEPSRCQQDVASARPNVCHGCKRFITERYLLKAVDKLWHEDCLKCSCCDCRLGEVGCTLFTRSGLLLCRRDYMRLFGECGYCCICSKIIPAFQMIMRARNSVYHLECFACQQCNHRFCVGDRYYLMDNTILCEYDYNSSRKLLNSKSNGHPAPDRLPNQSGSTDRDSRPDRLSGSDDRSSGYGSPSPNTS